MRETRGGRMSFTSYAEHMAFLDGLMADGYKLNGTDRKPNPSPDSRFFGVSWGVLADGKYIVKESGYFYNDFNAWIHPNDVQVTFIGVAAKDIRPGAVICASYSER